jgi:hypothetical protein
MEIFKTRKTNSLTMELQQSPLYASYIRSLKWRVITVDRINIFIRSIPFMGGLAKIQRPDHLPDSKKVIDIFREYKVRQVAVEAKASTPQETYNTYIATLSNHFKINRSPFLPTKTIRIHTRDTEDTIFHRFTEAKRRAVRKAQKNNITIEESQDIHTLIGIKNKSAGLFGSITTYGIKNLWSFFAPAHATTLLAYTKNHELVGGVLLIFWEKVCYYWVAGATKKGKKIAAPTLLVWEALLQSKKMGCDSFDFVGVWDERLPKENTSWKGFTKFKEGFGGDTLYFPILEKKL